MLLGLFFLFIFLMIMLIHFSVEFKLITEGLEIKPQIKIWIGPFSLWFPPTWLEKMGRRYQDRNFQSMERALPSLGKFLRVFNKFLQIIELFHLRVLVSTGDPFFTALGCGGLWAVISPFMTGLSTGHRLRTDPQIIIQPDYGKPGFQVYLHCIFQFRLGQIIINELKKVIFA